MTIVKSIARSMAMSLLISSSGFTAVAMTGACYQDRRPGGCYEQATKQENEKARQQKLYEEFRNAMSRGFPNSAFPTFCKISPDPRNNYATMAPAQNLSQKQMKTCIDASDAYMAQKQQKEQQQREAYEKETVWERLEADNGTVYYVDATPGHIGYNGLGAADIRVKSEAIPDGFTRLLFDCKNHRYTSYFERTFGWHYVPPRSILGDIESLACTNMPPPKL